MFSLLATVVTVLVVGSAMLWRAVRTSWRSRVRSRAVGNASLQTVEPAGGRVASTSSTRR